MLRSSVLLMSLIAGCALAPPTAVHSPTPLRVSGNNQEAVWERVVDLLHLYHFSIAREDRQDGTIETAYQVGSGLLEPWHPDAVGLENRLEGSLQSIRRKIIVHITPDAGGFLVTFEAFKELEDLDGIAANSAGAATFQESTPLERDLDLVVGQSAPSGWIPIGRDPLLERDLVARFRSLLAR